MAVRNIPLGYIGDRHTGPERSVISGGLSQLSALAIAVAGGRRLTGVPPRHGPLPSRRSSSIRAHRAVRSSFCPAAFAHSASVGPATAASAHRRVSLISPHSPDSARGSRP
jgi:hypothetical protein